MKAQAIFPLRVVPPAIRARINVEAHRLAFEYEARIKAEMLARVQDALYRGVSIDESVIYSPTLKENN